MSANIKTLRNRIKSVDSTLHLTKAMGLVASSKIRRAQENMKKSREYRDSFADVIASLKASHECEKSPYLKKQDSGKTKIIVIAGDRGLAGGYNANIFRLAKNYKDAEFIPIGKRACEHFKCELIFAESFKSADAVRLSNELCKEFAQGNIAKVGIISTKYVSMMTQEAQIKWILPLEKDENRKETSILFEPDENTILNAVIGEYIAGIIMAEVKESFLSEVAARRCAMDSAGKNAQEMIDELSLSYNRARQGAITQELTEIVAGSNA